MNLEVSSGHMNDPNNAVPDTSTLGHTQLFAMQDGWIKRSD